MSDSGTLPRNSAEPSKVDEVGAGEVILDLLAPTQREEEETQQGVVTPTREDEKGPPIPPEVLKEVPYYEMKVIITTPQYRGVPRGGFLISNSAKRVASLLLTDPEPSPVFSFRDKVPDPSKSDFLLLLSSIRRRGPAIHMLSLGEVTVLGRDLECVAALVDLLEEGYVYACDFGELRFTKETIMALLAAIRGGSLSRPPPTNLAFVYLDAALGLTNFQIDDIKETTRRRRHADKRLLPNQVDRLHGAWLLPESFQWMMASENLARCFWKPYQECLFWERMGFKVPAVKKGLNDPNYVQELTKRFHKGNMSASMLETVDPDDRSYLEECLEQWSRMSLLRMKARLRPSSASSSGHKSPRAKRARTMVPATTTTTNNTQHDVTAPRGTTSQKALRRAIPKSGTPNPSPPHAGPMPGIPMKTARSAPKAAAKSKVPPVPGSTSRLSPKALIKSSPVATPIRGGSDQSRATTGQHVAVHPSAGLSEGEIRKVVASQLDMSDLTRRAQFTLKTSPPVAKASSPRLRAAAAKSKPTLDDTHSSVLSSHHESADEGEVPEMGAIAARLRALTPPASDEVRPLEKPSELGSPPPPACDEMTLHKRDALLAVVAQGINDLRNTFPEATWVESKERQTLQELLLN